jgi:Fe-S-cluster-containing hydrogenase component 2
MDTCPVGAISLKESKRIEINPDKCIECGCCVRQCLIGAITVQDS